MERLVADGAVRDFDAGEGDVLRFVNFLDVGGDGPDLGDFSAPSPASKTMAAP